MTRTCYVAVAALAATLALAAGPAPDEAKLPDAARTALEKADQINVLSVDPQGGETGKDAFHEYKVLARTTVKDADARKDIASAVEKGVAEGGPIAKCFDRATACTSSARTRPTTSLSATSAPRSRSSRAAGGGDGRHLGRLESHPRQGAQERRCAGVAQESSEPRP